MPRVTIYIDRQTDSQARSAAKAVGLSYSRFIRETLRARVGTQWPEVVRALGGSIPDFPTAASLRTTLGKDMPRRSLE